ncbi:MAG: hypothetical protein WA615_24835, partial [Bradyrhizobium sp.]|uniref:hypothetical protein n=1 Tax=Bradyrhizobium sp. TaxID=376 RepID=UPI003C7C86E6
LLCEATYLNMVGAHPSSFAQVGNGSIEPFRIRRTRLMFPRHRIVTLQSDFRCWHLSDMPKYLGDVRCWVNSGKHLLTVSFSDFDPTAT